MYTNGITINITKFHDTTHVIISRSPANDPFDGIVIQKCPIGEFDAAEAEQNCDAKHDFKAFLSDDKNELVVRKQVGIYGGYLR